MFYDIVFPEGNEEDFITIAEKLNIDGLCFAYPYEDKKSVENAKNSLAELKKTTKIKLAAVFEGDATKIYKIHDLKEIAIAKASDNSRDVIAKYKPDVVYNLELSSKKDFAKSRNAGLDKAICQFANKNNVIIAFSFSSILNSKNLTELLGRIRQNITLCKKYKVKTAIVSFARDPYEMRSPHDLKSFLLSLGMYTANAKQSVEAISKLFD